MINVRKAITRYLDKDGKEVTAAEYARLQAGKRKDKETKRQGEDEKRKDKGTGREEGQGDKERGSLKLKT